MSQGSEIQVWIVDVEGTQLFFEAATTTQADSDLKQEIQQIIGTVRFGDTPTPGNASRSVCQHTTSAAPVTQWAVRPSRRADRAPTRRPPISVGLVCIS